MSVGALDDEFSLGQFVVRQLELSLGHSPKPSQDATLGWQARRPNPGLGDASRDGGVAAKAGQTVDGWTGTVEHETVKEIDRNGFETTETGWQTGRKTRRHSSRARVKGCRQEWGEARMGLHNFSD